MDSIEKKVYLLCYPILERLFDGAPSDEYGAGSRIFHLSASNIFFTCFATCGRA